MAFFFSFLFLFCLFVLFFLTFDLEYLLSKKRKGGTVVVVGRIKNGWKTEKQQSIEREKKCNSKLIRKPWKSLMPVVIGFPSLKGTLSRSYPQRFIAIPRLRFLLLNTTIDSSNGLCPSKRPMTATGDSANEREIDVSNDQEFVSFF